MKTLLHRSTIIATLIVSLALVSGCGSDGKDAEPKKSVEPAATSPAPSEAATDAASLCQALAVDDVAAATDMPLVEKRPLTVEAGGNASTDFTGSGCTFTDGDDARVQVALLGEVPTDPADVFAIQLADSAERKADDPSDEYSHREVKGLGDSAFFDHSNLSRVLYVLSGKTVVQVKGETADDEELSEDQLTSTAKLVVTALGG